MIDVYKSLSLLSKVGYAKLKLTGMGRVCERDE